jgi:outer membrane protein
MKFFQSFAIALLFVLVAGAGLVQAQTLKLGYTNIELIIANMPETKYAQQELQTHERKLQEQYQVKYSYAQSKQEEAAQKKQQGKLTPDQEKAAIDELKKLEEEIKQFAEESQTSLAKKRETLFGPIIEKVQKAVDDLAKEEGYTYVFNTGTGQGGSVLLHAPPQDNITEKVLKKLGITLPKEDPAGNKPAATGTNPK